MLSLQEQYLVYYIADIYIYHFLFQSNNRHQIPDLYFGKWPKWFEALCIIYPEAALSKIKNDTYSIGTVEFLKKVSDDKSYKAFIDHIVCIINDRTNQLNCCLVSTTN